MIQLMDMLLMMIDMIELKLLIFMSRAMNNKIKTKLVRHFPSIPYMFFNGKDNKVIWLEV